MDSDCMAGRILAALVYKVEICDVAFSLLYQNLCSVVLFSVIA